MEPLKHAFILDVNDDSDLIFVNPDGRVRQRFLTGKGAPWN
jgi:hypothetical protein